MLSSPNNTVSLYGFTATYVSGVWEITKNDPINGPDVTPLSTGMGVVLSEYCLPPGRYQFQVLNVPCVSSPYRLSVDLKECNRERLYPGFCHLHERPDGQEDDKT